LFEAPLGRQGGGLLRVGKGPPGVVGSSWRRIKHQARAGQSNLSNKQTNNHYLPSSQDDLPDTTQPGQFGTTKCGTKNSQSSECQVVHMNSLDDFCLWAPPKAGDTVGDSEQYEVAWCQKDGYGTRTIPAGTFTGLHWVTTPDYVQLTGKGKFTKVNVAAGDEGGELDPHGYNTYGNPIGGLVFVGGKQIHEWDSFISDDEFCFRACTGDSKSDASLWCNHVYDEMGCEFNMPSKTGYEDGFTVCEGESGELPGIYTLANGKVSTFSEGDGHTPTAHAPGASSNCKTYATISGGTAIAAATSAVTTSHSTKTTSVVKSTHTSAVAASSATLTTIPTTHTHTATTKTSSIIPSTHTSVHTSSVVSSHVSSHTSVVSSAVSSVVSSHTSVLSSSVGSVSSIPTAAPTTTSVPRSAQTSVVNAFASTSAEPSTSSLASSGQRVVVGAGAALLGLAATFIALA
jgi:hypothetical protein